MPLRFVLDEDSQAGDLWSAIGSHHAAGGAPIDIVRVGDEGCPDLGIPDPQLIEWAAQAGRILVSKDVSTLPRHLGDFIVSGRHSPGILFLRRGVAIHSIVEALALIAHAGVEEDFGNKTSYIPF